MRIIAAVFIAMLGVAPAFGQTAPAPLANNWSELRDPAGVFLIQVPQPATIKNESTAGQNGANIPVVEYTIDRGPSALIVMVGDFSGLNVDPSQAAAGAVRGVQTGNRKLLTDVIDSLDGQSGRFVTLTDTDANQFTDRIFFVGGRLYQVITVVPKNPQPDDLATATQFSRSFHFLAH